MTVCWPGILSYDKPISYALAERAAVLVMIAPWIALLERSAGHRSIGHRLARLGFLAFTIDRFMFDFLFWCPLAVLGAAGWRAAQLLRAGVAGDHRWAVALAIAAVFASVIGQYAPNMWVIRALALLVLLAALYGGRPRDAVPQAPRSPGTTAAVFLISAGLLALISEGMSQKAFLVGVAAGVVGWAALGFECWRQARSRRTWPLRVGLAASRILFGVLLAALLLECYFRYVFDASDSNGGLRTSERWAWRHVRRNSWGYRDREFPPPAAPKDRPRVVLLGDSFSFGWGIDSDEDRLGPQLERELAGRISPAPEVFTIAVGGVDTRREIEMFQRDGVQLRPDVVVLQYHLNDLQIPDLPERCPGLAFRMFEPITRGSDFAQLFLDHLYAALHQRDPCNPVAIQLQSYEDDATLERQAGTLRRLFGIVADSGAAPTAVLFPFLNLPTDTGAQRIALDRVATLLAAEHVPLVDVSKLVNVTEPRFHANRFDPHPGPALNRAVAPALADAVAAALAARPASRPVSTSSPAVVGSGRENHRNGH